MNIAFTICSNNYLAQAKVLGDSFMKYHPDFQFYIGLADKIPSELPEGYLNNFSILEVEELGITELGELNRKYNIIEFNTAVKPSYFKYFFTKLDARNVIYIDPDILVKSRLEEAIKSLKQYNIIITPHILSPIDDDFAPTDYHTLRGGVFNLGFIALCDYSQVKPFLEWWHERVIKYGYSNFALNMFYDQLWINYVPAFYNNYQVLKHPGYNMANWNLHERVLSTIKDQEYVVNNKHPLRFFHFSGYKYNKPEEICSYLSRYTFETRQDLIPIFKEYEELLIKNDVKNVSQMQVSYYLDLKKTTQKKTKLSSVKYRIKTAVRILFKGYM